MVGPRVLRDAKLGAEERSADLGNQLFGGIGLIAEALAISRLRRDFAPLRCVFQSLRTMPTSSAKRQSFLERY